jgi:threonine synthase
MVRAFKAGKAHATPILEPQTKIMPLATGDPGNTYELLKGLIENYGGAMEDASDEDAFATTHLLAQTEGISAEPAATLTFAGLINLVNQGKIKSEETVVVNCCGHTYAVEQSILGEKLITNVEVDCT